MCPHICDRLTGGSVLTVECIYLLYGVQIGISASALVNASHSVSSWRDRIACRSLEEESTTGPVWCVLGAWTTSLVTGRVAMLGVLGLSDTDYRAFLDFLRLATDEPSQVTHGMSCENDFFVPVAWSIGDRSALFGWRIWAAAQRPIVWDCGVSPSGKVEQGSGSPYMRGPILIPKRQGSKSKPPPDSVPHYSLPCSCISMHLDEW